MKNKKSILIFVIALVMTTTLTAKAQPLGGLFLPFSMEGSWKVTVVPQQAPIPLPPSVESIITYIPGGGLIETDNLAVPNTIAGNGQGSWELLNTRSTRRFTLAFTKYLFTTGGMFQGAVRVNEIITLDSSDSYRGSGTLETLSPTGATLGSIPFTSTGKRIRLLSATVGTP